METLSQFVSFIMESLFPHWPGIFFIFLITILAQTLKTRVFTKGMAVKSRTIFWGRRIYPVILLFLGVIPGSLWPGEVYPSVDTVIEKIFYFMGCSGISILGFNVFKQWVKKKYDLDIEEEQIDETSTGMDKETSVGAAVSCSGNTVDSPCDKV
jgi:hypothetical protein